jgi:hypothetical protein
MARIAENGASEELHKIFDRIGAGSLEERAEFVPHGSKLGEPPAM